MSKKIKEAIQKIVSEMGDKPFTSDVILQKLKDSGYSAYAGSTKSIGALLKIVAKSDSRGNWRKKDDWFKWINRSPKYDTWYNARPVR